jgi:hypothetical protein
MGLLAQRPKDTEGRAWHRSYRCSGIRCCEHAHPDIVTSCSAYDDVDPRLFHETRKRAAMPDLSGVSHTLQERTREYVYTLLIMFKY